MATARDTAIAGCDDALKAQIKKITEVLATSLALAKDDPAAKQAARERYTRGMNIAKEAHEINLSVIDEVFPVGG